MLKGETGETGNKYQRFHMRVNSVNFTYTHAGARTRAFFAVHLTTAEHILSVA